MERAAAAAFSAQQQPAQDRDVVDRGDRPSRSADSRDARRDRPTGRAAISLCTTLRNEPTQALMTNARSKYRPDDHGAKLVEEDACGDGDVQRFNARGRAGATRPRAGRREREQLQSAPSSPDGERETPRRGAPVALVLPSASAPQSGDPASHRGTVAARPRYNGKRGAESERPLRYGRLWRSTGQRCLARRQSGGGTQAGRGANQASRHCRGPVRRRARGTRDGSAAANVGRAERTFGRGRDDEAIPCGVSVSAALSNSASVTSVISILERRARSADSRHAVVRPEQRATRARRTILQWRLYELLRTRAPLRRRTTRCDRALCDGGGRELTSGFAKFYVALGRWNASCLF